MTVYPRAFVPTTYTCIHSCVGKPRITSQGTSFLVLLECLDATHANMLGVLFFSVMLNHVNTTECGYPKKLTPKKRSNCDKKRSNGQILPFCDSSISTIDHFCEEAVPLQKGCNFRSCSLQNELWSKPNNAAI